MSKVKYIGASDGQAHFGGCDDPREHLAESEIYEVVETIIHDWHTKIVLRGFPELRFNDVCFETVES